ncbi:proton channel OtopLc-like [Harmonia axyridis]|uniref:proton channel OtopLc-like n=1 Tax=Harmonia axyridis TaxID=115357 RepID=UPI001E277CF4|nr:proton channel OtopLc-like [Harmonia axyridis]
MNRLPNRLHCSSPVLTDEGLHHHFEPRTRRRKNLKEKIENEFLVNFIATLYCKALVVLGVALPITDAITLNINIYIFRIYHIYLYSGSIIFLCYMCLVQLKEKSVRLSLHEMQSSVPLSFESAESENINQPVRYGSFYLRMGVTGFGMGSVIYSGFQFAQYFEYSTENDCGHPVKAIKPGLRIIFVLMQIFFVLSTNNFIHVQKSKMIARFGLMHMIGTNLCEWFQVVVKETQHDIYKTAQKFLANNPANYSPHSIVLETKRFYDKKEQCMITNIIGPILFKTEPYLAPCIIEFSVLCAVILGLMWKKNLTHGREKYNPKFHKVLAENFDTRTKSRFSVDFSKAHKGLFSGILVIIITIMSLIVYSELETHEKYWQIGILLVNSLEFLLFWAGTLASVLCIISIRDIGYYKMSRQLELEHLLLILSQSGIFIYNLFQILGTTHMVVRGGVAFNKIIRILTSISCVIESCSQTTLVLIAWRRRCVSKSHIRKKPGKQLVTFLLLSNFASWVICRFNHNKSTSHPIQMDFYGLLAWNIITHVSIPLMLTYRFQSTVCFYEIWTHVYKTTPIGSSCRDFSVENDN